MRRPPCRLFVCPAAEAPLAVVVRRGPTEWARLSVWHTDTDRIEHGQWVRARLYERRCDVSPDGRLFACFAHRGAGRSRDLETDSWAAISRPPWVSALAVWGIGSTYFPGGFFTADDGLVLGGVVEAPDRGRVPDWLRLLPMKRLPFVDPTPEWPDRVIAFNRLLRGGWRADPGPESPAPVWSRRLREDGPALLMFPLPSRPTLREFALQRGGDLLPLGTGTWADWDHGGRLVMAREGQLVTVDPESGSVHPIADFNRQRPEAIEAPDAVLEWPERP